MAPIYVTRQDDLVLVVALNEIATGSKPYALGATSNIILRRAQYTCLCDLLHL